MLLEKVTSFNHLLFQLFGGPAGPFFATGRPIACLGRAEGLLIFHFQLLGPPAAPFFVTGRPNACLGRAEGHRGSLFV